MIPPAPVDRHQLEMLLAIASDSQRRSLLTDCTPPIISAPQLGGVQLHLGVPNGQGQAIGDGVLVYEELTCQLAWPDLKSGDRPWLTQNASLTAHQSPLQTLGWRVPLAEAIALLTYGGFSETQIDHLLHLPWDGWHRSWWHPITPSGPGPIPFRRHLRVRLHPEGTYILQYQDHYHQDAPPCFRSQWHTLPLVIHQPNCSLGEHLLRLHQAQQDCQSPHTLLLAGPLSPLEETAFTQQGVPHYPISRLCAPQRPAPLAPPVPMALPAPLHPVPTGKAPGADGPQRLL